MLRPQPSVWLEACLAPLAPILADPAVTDICVNRPGEVWVERLGSGTTRHEMSEVTGPLLQRLARQIAALTSQGVSREHPLLAASLPGGERVQIVLPPATRAHVALAIRKHASADRTLDDYSGPGHFGDDLGGAREAAPTLKPGGDVSRDPVAALRDAVRLRRNILISGGTSSGKTTFLNALMAEIPRDERLIVIEDTPELRLVHANAVGLLAVRGQLGEAAVTPEDLLVASLRMRPDRIILGEVRGSEAMTFLRAINTGHPGSLGTIHADSPQGAIDQLVMLALQAGSRMRWEDIARYVCRTVDLIVQLERIDGQRRVSRILEPRSLEGSLA